MKRNMALLLCVVVAAMLLVVSTHRARTVFAELQKAKAVQRQLEGQYRRLEAQRQQSSKNLAVERVAQSRLRMNSATPEVTEYVRAVSSSAPAGGGHP